MSVYKKPVVIRYHRLETVSAKLGRGVTLEDKLREAFDTVYRGKAVRRRVTSRIWGRGENGADQLFINYFHDRGDLFAGDVIHFTKGELQPILKVNAEAELLDIAQLKPAEDDQEFVHSVLYFMIKGNHALLITSRSINAATFEKYLHWLLSTHTKVLPDTSSLVLASRFDASLVGGDIENISEIIVGGVAAPPRDEEHDERATTGRRQASRRVRASDVQRGLVMDLLVALLGEQRLAERAIRSVPEDAMLKVALHIGFQTRKRKFSKLALSELEVGLRHLPDGQVTVKAKNQTRDADGEIRLHHKTSVAMNGSLLQHHDALRAFEEAYETFVENGSISR